MFDIVTFAKLLLIIGGIVWGIFGVMNVNIIKETISKKIAQQFIYIIVGIAALFLLFNRNFYLPFLDKTIVPFTFFKKDQVPQDGTFKVQVQVIPNARVIYWAAEPNKKDETSSRSVHVAYGQFENSGITTADINGIATLHLRMPASYTIDKKLFKKHIEPHVHYRYTLSDGMLSQVLTHKVKEMITSSGNVTTNVNTGSLVDTSSKISLEKDLLQKNKLPSSPSSKSPRSSKSSRSSSKSSRSSSCSSRSSSKSSPSNIKHMGCGCPKAHKNKHESTCPYMKIKQLTMHNPNIKMAQIVNAPTIAGLNNSDKYKNYKIHSPKSKLFKNDNELNRSLETTLKDRDIQNTKLSVVIYENNFEMFDNNYENI